jgi:hypothetical protein
MKTIFNIEEVNKIKSFSVQGTLVEVETVGGRKNSRRYSNGIIEVLTGSLDNEEVRANNTKVYFQAEWFMDNEGYLFTTNNNEFYPIGYTKL